MGPATHSAATRRTRRAIALGDLRTRREVLRSALKEQRVVHRTTAIERCELCASDTGFCDGRAWMREKRVPYHHHLRVLGPF